MSNSALQWSTEDSARLYGIDRWGNGIFDIDTDGDMTVALPDCASVSIRKIITGARQRGHTTPLLLRVENILADRIKLLHDSFNHAISTNSYNGNYCGVFPVKVNQQRQVIEEICRCGAPHCYGLEAGSKAELALALANLNDNALLIMNGYKDRAFVDMGLWARRLGQRCIFVIESLDELTLVLERSTSLGIKPLLGARIKVAVKVAGMWTETSGDRSSFGLDSRQLVTMLDILRQHDKLDCLRLLHCHLGSQIPALDDIRAGVNAACRYYASMVQAGAAMGYIDFGGGLAVDYSGCTANLSHSCDYTLRDYATTIVNQVRSCMETAAITHPHIVTESGRAMVAHASMLLFDVIDVMHFEAAQVPTCPAASWPTILHQLYALRQNHPATATAYYHRATELRNDLRRQFQNGAITLRERACGEDIYLAIVQQLARQHTTDLDNAAAAAMRQNLADIYYGNFSVFQSLPDTWAIGQYFPVVPLQRLHQHPDRRAIIADLTCDCDGKLDRFIVNGREQSTLPLHQPLAGEIYYLGVFLMGAYQETLGDIHNLFGDTNVISVRINKDGGVDYMQELSGETVADTLKQVQYNYGELQENLRRHAERLVRNGVISVDERQLALKQFATCLSDYTYYRTTAGD